MSGYVVNLNSANLDLDALSGWQSSTTTAEQPAVTSAPVIASQVDDRQQNLEALRDFTAQLNLQAAQVTYRGMNVTQLAVTADNQRGSADVAQACRAVGRRRFSLPGTLDARGNKPVISVQPVLNQVELGTVLKAFDMPQMLTGKFSMKGSDRRSPLFTGI